MTIFEDFVGMVCSGCGQRKATRHSFCGRCYHILLKRANEAQQRIKTLREALEWYAGESDSLPHPDADDGNAWHSNKDVPSIPNIIFDQGKRARAALAEPAEYCSTCGCHLKISQDCGCTCHRESTSPNGGKDAEQK